jgi:multidrug efflux pump subunit AcrA (membrane-fusion protein)
MTERTKASWSVYALGALSAGAIAAAVLVVEPASGSQRSQTRTATVAQGVVQSTVSGSGNLQPASQPNLGFKTSGTVTHIYVTQGERVVQGQLLATLNPQSAEVTLEQAKASLTSAEANLQAAEANSESASGQSSGGSGAGSTSTASTASVHRPPARGVRPARAASSAAVRVHGCRRDDARTVRSRNQEVWRRRLPGPRRSAEEPRLSAGSREVRRVHA